MKKRFSSKDTHLSNINHFRHCTLRLYNIADGKLGHENKSYTKLQQQQHAGTKCRLQFSCGF